MMLTSIDAPLAHGVKAVHAAMLPLTQFGFFMNC